MKKTFYRNLGKKIVLLALVAIMLIGAVAAAGISVSTNQITLSDLHANTTNVIVAAYNADGQMLFAKLQSAGQKTFTADLTNVAFLRVFETNAANQPTTEVTVLDLRPAVDVTTAKQLQDAFTNGGSYRLKAMDEFQLTADVTVQKDVSFIVDDSALLSLSDVTEDDGVQDYESAVVTFLGKLTVESGKTLTIGEGIEFHCGAVENNGKIVADGTFRFDDAQYTGTGECTGINKNMLSGITISDGYSISYNYAQLRYTVRIPAGRPQIPEVSAAALPGATVTVTQAKLPDSAESGIAYVNVTDGEISTEYQIKFIRDPSVGFQLQYDDYYTFASNAVTITSSDTSVIEITPDRKLHAKKVSNDPVTVRAYNGNGEQISMLTVDKVIKAPINICMIIGQSNAYGFLDVPAGYAYYADYEPIEKAQCDAPAPGTVWCDDISTGYDEYWFSGMYDLSRKRTGFSPALGKQWYNLTGEKSMMLQTAIGSTPIEAWTKNPALKFFGIDCYAENLERFNFYKNKFNAADSNFVLKHVYAFWAQGETCQEFTYLPQQFVWEHKNGTPNYPYIGDWVAISTEHPAMTAAQYNGFFMSMVEDLRKDTGLEFIGIMPVRSQYSVSSEANRASQQLTDLVPSRAGQYALNNMGDSDISFVTLKTELARTANYPDVNAEGYGWIGCNNIHFTQKGYNAIGKDAADNAVAKLYGKAVSATELKVIGTDGKKTYDDGATIIMSNGDTLQITAIALPLYACDTAITYTSSDSSVFTVDEYGKLTAVGNPGDTATLTITNGNLTTELTVCVPSFTTLNTVAQIDSTARFMGRTFSDSNVHWFDWTLSGFEFSFNGIGATARLRSNTGWGGASPANNTSVVVYVDGEEEPSNTIELSSTDATYTLIDGLKPGNHTVKVLKKHDIGYASAGVQELSVINGSFNNKPTSEAVHKIEFIGDSLTSGDGLWTNNKNVNGGYISINQDGTKSHAKLIGDAFNADINVISWCGRGVVWNCDGKDEAQGGEPMTIVYPLTDYYYNKSQQWNFSSFQSELIVLNLGTNDYGSIIQSAANETRFVDTYVSFLKTIRSKNPNATILCTCGTTFSETGCRGFTAKMSGIFDRISAKAVQEGLSNLDFFLMPDDFEESDGRGNDIHASPASQAKTAGYLIEEIESVMGWNTVD